MLKSVQIMLPEFVRHPKGGGDMVCKSIIPLFEAHLETTVCWFEKEDPILDPNILTIFPVLGYLTSARKVFTKIREKDFPTAYYAQAWGTGKYDLQDIVKEAPILCVSKFLMSKWTQVSPTSPVFYLPPTIDPPPTNVGDRDIDVLIFKRKMDHHTYEVLDRIKDKCNVHIQESFLPLLEAHALFNRAKVYIYCVPPVLALGGPEGFGMQPVEARILGCHVFSSLFGGLAENIDTAQPRMSQIGIGVDIDAERVLRAVRDFSVEGTSEVREQFSLKANEARVERILKVLDFYYTHKKTP